MPHAAGDLTIAHNVAVIPVSRAVTIAVRVPQGLQQKHSPSSAAAAPQSEALVLMLDLLVAALVMGSHAAGDYALLRLRAMRWAAERYTDLDCVHYNESKGSMDRWIPLGHITRSLCRNVLVGKFSGWCPTVHRLVMHIRRTLTLMEM